MASSHRNRFLRPRAICVLERSSGFSMKAPEDVRFLTRSRVFTDDDVEELEAAEPPAMRHGKCPKIAIFVDLSFIHMRVTHIHKVTNRLRPRIICIANLP